MERRSLAAGLCAALLIALSWNVAQAADLTSKPAAAAPPPSVCGDAGGPSTIASALGPIGNWGGLRDQLSNAGINFALAYNGEVLGNVSGGEWRGTIYEDRIELDVDGDLCKLLGWQGGAIHASGFQIDGKGLSGNYLFNLLAVSNIEALGTTRLFELWFEQKLLDDKVALRVGQLSADTEFQVSKYAGLFIDGTFGWPTLSAADLPSGGPAYPLATPGVRLKVSPTDNINILAGVYNGDPAGPGPGNPQARDRYGTNFRVTDPALLIGELQYSYNQDKDLAGLPGTVYLGAWHHFGSFADERYATDGLSLADPSSTGIASTHEGNSALYAMWDQMIYRVPGSDSSGIGLFMRSSFSPSDRNLVSFYLDGGLNFSGMVPGRPNDSFGIAGGYAKISNSVRGFDEDTIAFSGITQPVHDHEATLELTYQAQIVPGWTVQPDFQYFFHPGGNALDPYTGQAIKDAAVFGIRTTIQY